MFFSVSFPASQPIIKCRRAFQALVSVAVEELCHTATSLIVPVRLGIGRPTAPFSLVSTNLEAVQVGYHCVNDCPLDTDLCKREVISCFILEWSALDTVIGKLSVLVTMLACLLSYRCCRLSVIL